ncbi:MAG: hypothetical protein GYA57_00285 [Myxococcales bacterium]|nr:hypothetical protein [Myxococcales bacterium]
MKQVLGVVGLAVALLGCPSGIPGVEGVTGGGDVMVKYDAWLAHVDELQASVEDAQKWVVDAPKELAVTLGLPETATLDEITAAIREKLAAAGVTAEAGLTVEVNAEAGASGSAEAGTGGASAEGEAHASVEVRIVAAAGVELTPEAQQILDAVKLCLERVAGIKPRLEAIVANLETVINEGKDLLVSLPNDLQGALAVKVPEYTAQFNAKLEFLAGVGGSAGGTIEASVNIQVSVTASVTGG